MSQKDPFDDWDGLLNPYNQSMEVGRKEGELAGLQSGMLEGTKLGHVTALDFGTELGFIHGVATQLLDSIDILRMGKNWDERYYQRFIYRLRELVDLVDAFPDPSSIFASRKNPSSNMDSDTITLKSTSGDYPNDNFKHLEFSQEVDVHSAMENIRSRFKVVIAQIHAPELNLQTLLSDRHTPPTTTDPNSWPVTKDVGSIQFKDYDW
jgi:hypothetical protein